MQKMYLNTLSYLGRGKIRLQLLAVTVVVGALSLGLVGSAGAVETEGEKGIHEVTAQVSTEGQAIMLDVLTGLAALIAMVLILPKAVRFVKKFF